MLTRGKVLLLTILCLLSLVSIGFASWTITESDEEIVYGSMQTDNVINSAEFVQLNRELGETENPGIKCFDYQESGYLSEDGTYVTDTGYIYIYFVLDLEKCYNLFSSDYNSIDITLNLRYASSVTTDLNLFKYSINDDGTGYHDISSTCSSETSGVTIELEEIDSTIDQQYSVKLKFKQILATQSSNSKVYFTVKYALFATTGDYFYNEIFQKMYMDMINAVSFEMNVYLSGNNYEV